jgi:hypothetical protein
MPIVVDNLIPMLQSVAASLDNHHTTNCAKKSDSSNSDNALNIDWQYHPNNLSKNMNRTILNKTLKLSRHENSVLQTQEPTRYPVQEKTSSNPKQKCVRHITTSKFRK